MDYGAKYIRWAPFAAESPQKMGKLPSYGPAITLGALNKATDTPAFNEAKGYGDNVLKVYVNKFKETVIAIETTEVPRDSMSAVSGTTLESETKKNMRFRSTDKTPYGGLGFFVSKILDDGRDVCMGIFYPKVKAMLQGATYNTDGENITLSTSKLQFTGSACDSGDWKIESDFFETEAAAQAWVDGMFDGTSTDIGNEAGGEIQGQSATARAAGKAATV